MNKIYSLVWNRSRNQIEVASELARSHGGGGAGWHGTGTPLALKGLVSAMLLCGTGWAPHVFAQTANCTYTNTATGTILCGFNASATGNGAIAIGDNSISNGTGAIAEGNAASSYGNQATALGGGAQAGKTGGITNQSVAIGAFVGATGDQSTAMGNNAQAAGNSAIAIGGDDLDKVANATYTAIINGTSVTATGAQLYTDLTGSTAIAAGVYHTPVAGDGSVAFGPQAMAGGTFNGANPTGTFTPNGVFDVAIGAQANATGFSSIALGTGAAATADTAFAIGPNSRASAPTTIAFGISALANQTNAVAIGTGGTSTATYTQATGAGATALGGNATAGANASGANAIAIGGQSVASGTSAIALGRGATAGKNFGVAIGDGATAGATADDVALGASSSTRAASTGPYTINGGTIAATSDTNGVVSVGAAGKERQIQNVAAGTISQTSTDAVNGSQLYAVGTQVNTNTANIATNTTAINNLDTQTDNLGTSVASTLGDGTTYNSATGTISGFSAPINTVSVVGAVSGPTNETTVGAALSQLNSNIDNTANVAVKYDAAGGNKITLGATGGAGAGAPVTITNVAPGAVSATSTDAVNGSQLYGVQQLAGEGWNLTTSATGSGIANGSSVANVAPGATATITADNNIITTQNGTQVAIGLNPVLAGLTSLSIAGGPTLSNGGIDMGGEKISNLAPGTAGTDAVDFNQLNAAVAAATTHDYSVNSTNPGTDTNYNDAGATGANALAAGVSASASGTSALAVGQNSSANGTNGIAIGTNANAAGNGAISFGNGSSAAAAGALSFGNGAVSNTSADVAIGNNANASGGALGAIAIGTGTKAQSSAVVIGNGAIAKSSNGTPIAIGFSANAVSTNGGSGIAIGDWAKASGVGAIALGGQPAGNYNPGQSTLAIGDRSLALGNASSSNAADSVALGSSAITVTAATKGVAIGSGATANNANDVALGSGSTTNAPSTGPYTINGGAIAASADTNGVVSIGTVGHERQIQNLAAGTVSATSTDAVNGSQLYAVGASVNNLGSSIASGLGGASSYNPNTGTVTTSLNVGGTGYNNVNSALNAVNATANEGWNVTTNATGSGIANGSSVANVAPGATATITADNNIITTQNGTQVAIGLNPVLAGLTSLSIAGGPTLSNGGIDMGGEKISNLAPGTAGTDAVNLNQLNAVSAVANEGWNLSANGGTAVNIKPGATVDVSPGTSGNITVAQDSTTGNLTIDTNPDLNVTSVTAGNTVLNGSGVTISGGPNGTVSLGNSGLDNGGNAITNVAPGVVSATSTDAVNGSQLYGVQQLAGEGWNLTTSATGSGIANGSSVANVAPGATATITADNNIITTQNGTQVAIGLNPVLAGLTSLSIAGGPTLSNGGIDMGGEKISNLAPGTDPNDAVTLGQLDGATAAVQTHYYSVNDGGTPDGNYNNDGATGVNALAAGVGASATADNSTAIGANAVAKNAGDVALGAGSVTAAPNPTSGTTLYGTAYSFAGADPQSVVSVGSAGNERQITNVAAGQLNSNSTDAVNGSQLYATNQALTAIGNQVTINTGDISNLQNQINTINQNGAGMFQTSSDRHNQPMPTASGTDSAAGGAGASASGSDSLAVGNDSNASGDGSTAIGTGAQASGNNSVAIGAGSVASGDNTVSVGSQGNERRITNVAAGVDPTDAVNVSQLQTAQAGGVHYDSNSDGSVNYQSVTLDAGGPPTVVHNVANGTEANDAVNVGQLNAGVATAENWAQNYTDQQLRQLNNRAEAGIASAIAAANLPQPYAPNQSALSVGFGTFRGESGMAIGLSRITENGRYILKANASSDTRGNFGGGVGAAVVW